MSAPENDLNVVLDDDGETQIWWEDIMCLGSGDDLDEAVRSVADTIAAIIRQLPNLKPE